jgi:hypothetical protein
MISNSQGAVAITKKQEIKRTLFERNRAATLDLKRKVSLEALIKWNIL